MSSRTPLRMPAASTSCTCVLFVAAGCTRGALLVLGKHQGLCNNLKVLYRLLCTAPCQQHGA